jgi:hypothetical protein
MVSTSILQQKSGCQSIRILAQKSPAGKWNINRFAFANGEADG